MRVLLQRVSAGSVTVAGEVTGAVDAGFVALVGVTEGDTEEIAAKLAGKTANLRVFSDEAGVMNRSLLDVGGGALVVSQFTLYADARKGRRPELHQGGAAGCGRAGWCGISPIACGRRASSASSRASSAR